MCTSKPKKPAPPPPPPQPEAAPDQDAIQKRRNTQPGMSGAPSGNLLTGNSGISTNLLNLGGAKKLGGS